MSQDQAKLLERVQRSFDHYGRPATDYAVLTDTQPPSIFFVSPDGVALLHIEESSVVIAYAEFLVQRGARTFATFDEFDRAYHVRREIQPKRIDP